VAFGDPLTKERLSWQLERLAQMGHGTTGLQINYAHSDKGGLSYGYSMPSEPPLFSDEWWKLVQWFMQEVKKRDIAISLSDYTVGIGQGWKWSEFSCGHFHCFGYINFELPQCRSYIVDYFWLRHSLTLTFYKAKKSYICSMFVRKKNNRSGSTSVVVVDKSGGKIHYLKTIGVSSDETEIAELYRRGKKWVSDHNSGKER
jgi:hypothetical protein